MTRPAVLIISFSTITSDARLLKQIDALSGDNDLTVVGYGSAPAGVVEFISIPDSLVYWRYDRVALILRAYKRAYWSNPVIAHLATALKGRVFDAIVANDIDSVGLAVSLDPRGGVHADLHEYAPRQKEEVVNWRRFVAPFLRWLCRTYVSEAYSVTTVGRGIADEYARQFGFVPEVVTNAAPFADLEPTPVTTPLRLVHSGACLRDRGITEIAQAAVATSTDVTLDLFLMPNDPVYLDELRTLAELEERITLHPAVPYSELVTTLNAFDVGIHALPPVSFNNAMALPNKFFDYVQARLAILVGPSPEMQRIVRERDLGAVARGFGAEEIREVLDGLEPAAVSEWKAASALAAHDLSAERQVSVWQRAVAAITARAGRAS